MFKKKTGYDFVEGGIERTRPSYSKLDTLFSKVFVLAGSGVVFLAVSTFAMIIYYKLGGR